MVTLPHSLISEVVCQPVGSLIQFPVTQAPAPADNRGAIRHGIDDVLDKIRDIESHAHTLEHVIVPGNGLHKSAKHPKGSGSVTEQPHALVEQRGHTLVVTMNRPEARNALTGEMLTIMAEAWDRVDQDDEIRSCILTGAGGAFCAGADLKAMNRTSPDAGLTQGSWDPSRMDGLLKGRRLTKPLLAAIEGPAIAGGTEILQGTDIRIAGESAKFGVSEARWGLFPLGGSAVRLPRQIPYTKAAEILLTGKHLSATEAEAIGLIGHVVPDGTALASALEIAERIAENGPLAVQAILRTMRDTEGMHEEEAFRLEAQYGMKVFTSQDAQEGPRAFAEKRRPRFQGR